MKTEKKNVLNVAATDMQEVNQAIEVLKTKLLPFLEVATKEELKTLPKLKDKSFAFVTKAYEHTNTHPVLVPNYIDKDSFKLHMETLEQLRTILNPIKEFHNGLEDTITIMGSDAYNMALSFYSSIKTASKNNVSGAKVIYEDLKIRFVQRNKYRSMPKNDAVVE